MKLIDRLLTKAKSRPLPVAMGMVMPYEDDWHVTLHFQRKGKLDTMQESFHDKADAVAWAKENLPASGRLMVVCSVDEKGEVVE